MASSSHPHGPRSRKSTRPAPVEREQKRRPFAVWALIVWVALWADLSWSTLITGVIVALVVGHLATISSRDVGVDSEELVARR